MVFKFLNDLLFLVFFLNIKKLKLANYTSTKIRDENFVSKLGKQSIYC
jgi:hypothetical protein